MVDLARLPHPRLPFMADLPAPLSYPHFSNFIAKTLARMIGRPPPDPLAFFSTSLARFTNQSLTLCFDDAPPRKYSRKNQRLSLRLPLLKGEVVLATLVVKPPGLLSDAQEILCELLVNCLEPLQQCAAKPDVPITDVAALKPLTPHEALYLYAMSQLQDNHGVAGAFAISPNTIRTNNDRIFKKLQATSLADALKRAWHQGDLDGLGLTEEPWVGSLSEAQQRELVAKVVAQRRQK